MAMIHVSRSSATLGVFEEEKVREGLRTGEFIGTDLGWTEGMSNWRPLSELDTFSTPAPPLQTPVVPVVQPTAAPSFSPAPERTGLPWENRSGRSLINALFETIAMVLTRPGQAFTVMKRDDGLGDPLLYALICGTAGAVISLGFSLMMQSFGLMAGSNDAIAALFGIGFGMVFVILLMPVFVVIGTFIWAAIMHVCLMVVGGAKQSFETTFRVASYAGGSANALAIVPVCGGMLALVASIVLNSIGLARAHETDTWRALVAVFLPFVLCCGGGVVLFLIIVAGAAGSANWH